MEHEFLGSLSKFKFQIANKKKEQKKVEDGCVQWERTFHWNPLICWPGVCPLLPLRKHRFQSLAYFTTPGWVTTLCLICSTLKHYSRFCEWTMDPEFRFFFPKADYTTQLKNKRKQPPPLRWEAYHLGYHCNILWWILTYAPWEDCRDLATILKRFPENQIQLK